MKQLSSFAIINLDDECKVSFTFDIIDDKTGTLISQNNQGGFTALEEEMLQCADGIRAFVQENKLNAADVLKMVIVTSAGGLDRITFIYDKVVEDGSIVKESEKGRFYAVDNGLKEDIACAKAYISNKLEG